jgi:hypothetical protein
MVEGVNRILHNRIRINKMRMVVRWRRMRMGWKMVWRMEVKMGWKMEEIIQRIMGVRRGVKMEEVMVQEML